MDILSLILLTEVNTGEREANIAWLGPVFSVVLLVVLVLLVRSFIRMSRRAREATWDTETADESTGATTPADKPKS